MFKPKNWWNNIVSTLLSNIASLLLSRITRLELRQSARDQMFKPIAKPNAWLLYGIPVILVSLFATALTVFFHNQLNLGTTDTLTLAQLILSGLLLPTVIIGFAITVQAFRENQEHPELDIYFESPRGDQWKSLNLSKTDIKNDKYFPIMVINKGSVIALWYTIILFSPDVNILGQNLWEDHWKEFVMYTIEHWQFEDHWQFDRREPRFISNGNLALYPNVPLQFCQISAEWLFLSEAKRHRNEFQLFYVIVSDRGHNKSGTLNITFQTETT